MSSKAIMLSLRIWDILLWLSTFPDLLVHTDFHMSDEE